MAFHGLDHGRGRITLIADLEYEAELRLLDDRLSVEYSGALGATEIHDVVTRTSNELGGAGGAHPPLETVAFAVRRRLVRMLTVPRPRG